MDEALDVGDDDHIASSTPTKRNRGPHPRASTFDDAPLLDVTTLEVATEAASRSHDGEESFQVDAHGLRLKRIIAAVATVGLLVVIAACSWAINGSSDTYQAPPNLPLSQAIRNDATDAITSHIHTHVVFQSVQPPLVTSDTSEASTGEIPVFSTWAAVNITVAPTYTSQALAVHIPAVGAQQTMLPLLRVQIFGMDQTCSIHGVLCLCGGTSPLPPVLQGAAPAVSRCAPTECGGYLIERMHVAPRDAYGHENWYKLHLPCTLLPVHEYTIEWLFKADAVFQPSTPYPPGAAVDSVGVQLPNVALFGSLKRFVPSTLALGSQAAYTHATVSAPAGLKVLTSTEESGSEAMHDGRMRTARYKAVQGISSNMLAIGVGVFTRLATGFDAQHRPVSVWALPGAVPADADLSLQVLSNATTAWANFTGEPLLALGKLDMLIWNGDFPWSTSQHGLLLMDRFRTLWNAEVSTATDLVRCAHVICHETGHLWFGGFLQTLNETGRSFIEESTTSYGEVFCVAQALPGPLSASVAFTRMFFPEFGDTRSLHAGAEFHATRNLALPENANESILSSSAAFYTKGAAFLHMLESYMDAAIRPGQMHKAVQAFFQAFPNRAVTATDLLCALARELAGCDVAVASGYDPCGIAEATRPPGTNSTVDSAESIRSSCSMLLPWLKRLEAWIEEPGVQVVEVSEHDLSTGATTAAKVVQAKLLPNILPGQAATREPLWVPVSLVDTTAAAVCGANNDTLTSGMHQERWLEVFPPWEDEHRISVVGTDTCSESSGDEDAACGRPLLSPPLTVPSGAGPWLPKGRAGPFLAAIPDKEHQDALVKQLRQLKVSGGAMDLSNDHPDMVVLQGFSSLLHDTRMLFRAAPTAELHHFLVALTKAAFQCQAAAQTGLSSYMLLGPATAALWDLHLLARGDTECARRVSDLEKSIIVHNGAIAWKRVLHRAASNEDVSRSSQDQLFSRAIAARVIPRAVRYDSDLAAAVCSLLEPAAENASLEELLDMVNYAPDLQNVVLESAIAANRDCNSSSTVRKALIKHLKTPVGDSELLPHLRRSASFILAASHDREALHFLVHAAVLGQNDGIASGLREVDKVTLFHRIVRSSITGFRAAAETVQKYAASVETWGDAEAVAQLAPWVVTGLDSTLPEWLPAGQPRESQYNALMLHKQSDVVAAQIVCGAA